MQVTSFQKLLDNLLEKPALWRVFCYINSVLKSSFLIGFLIANSFLLNAQSINVKNIDITPATIDFNDETNDLTVVENGNTEQEKVDVIEEEEENDGASA